MSRPCPALPDPYPTRPLICSYVSFQVQVPDAGAQGETETEPQTAQPPTLDLEMNR